MLVMGGHAIQRELVIPVATLFVLHATDNILKFNVSPYSYKT